MMCIRTLQRLQFQLGIRPSIRTCLAMSLALMSGLMMSGCSTRESPNGAYQKLVNGVRSENFQLVVDSLSTETVNNTLDTMLRALRPQIAILGLTGPGREFIDIFKKYGVDLQKLDPGTSNTQIVERLTDRYQCLVDVLGFSYRLQKQNPGGAAALASFSRIGQDPNTTLANIKYDGDRCTAEARYTVDGKKYREPLNFVRQGGTWRIAQVPSTPDTLASRGPVSGNQAVAVSTNSAPAHGTPQGEHGAPEMQLAQATPGTPSGGHNESAAPTPHAAPAASPPSTPAGHGSETPVPMPLPEQAATPPGHAPEGQAPGGNNIPRPQTPNGHGEMANAPAGLPPAGEGNNPANPGGANPGGAVPGVDGQNPANSIPQAPTFPLGTAEYAVQKICLSVAAGQYTGLDGVISEKADGLLAQIRDGAVSEDEIQSLKKRFGEVRLLSVKPKGGTRTVTLQNTSGESLVFTLAKEDEIFRVKDLDIKQPASAKRKKAG